MSRAPARPAHHREPRGGDAGVTLVELLVAMVVYGVLSAVVVAAVVSLSRASDRVTGGSATQAAVWSAFVALDRQVRYADAINLPGTTGGAAYVELRTTAPTDTSPRCYQWRYTPSSGALQVRSWDAAPGAAPGSAWKTVVSGQPTAAGTQPFTTLTTTATTPHELLRVNLVVTAEGGGSSSLSTTFAALNTTPQSPGNADAAPQDGVSDQPVCAGHRS